MSKKQKIALYIVGGVAALGIVILLWWAFGQFVASAVAVLFGMGGEAARRKYTQADIDGQQRQAAIEANAKRELDRIDLEDKYTAGANEAKKQQRDKARDAWAQANEARANGVINKAKTTQELSRFEDDELAKLEAMLPPERGEDGFARVVLLWVLLLTMVLLMTLFAWPTHAEPATSEDKARTARRVKVLQRAQKEVQRLRDLLEYRRSEYMRQMSTLRKRQAVELQRERSLRASDQRECAEKMTVLNKRRCPPTWPAGMVGGAAGVVLGVIGCGVFIAARPKP